MNQIFALVRRDARHALSNVMAVIVIFGLTIIPALFTWFNVIASWDPFSNTKNLRVAVANTDEGYQGDLVPIRINVGEQVISALRANDDLDWVVTSEEDAVDGTRSGAYYAAIVLPPSFSADMLTFFSDGAERSDIAFYTNEKKNALAPKITGQGAEGVSAQITEVFARTLSEVGLGLLSSLSDVIGDPDTQQLLTRLETRVSGVSTQLRAGASTAQMFSSLLGSSVPLAQSAQGLITASGAAFEQSSDAAAQGAAAAEQLQGTLGTATASLGTAISQTVAGYAALGTSVDQLFAQANGLSATQVAVLGTLADRVQVQIDDYTRLRDRLQNEIGPSLPASAQPALAQVIARLDEAIARQRGVHDKLVAAADSVSAGNAAAQASRGEVQAAIAEAQTALRGVESAYSGQLKPQLDQLSQTLTQIGQGVDAISSDLGVAGDELAGAAGSVASTLGRGQSSAAEIASSLNDSAATFDDLAAALAKARDTGEFSELQAIIGADPATLAAALGNPVGVERIPVFPISGFGAAMAPLYSMLALWVGALLMTVAIRVDVPAGTLPGRVGENDLSPTQKYLGRYGVFGLIGLAQSALLTVGLVLFVKIEPAHPWLLILAGIATSLVFTLIIYTLVVAFGNAGKALAVLLLVIQISGAGGAYPLQLLPQWFQNVSPFLPATHAINAMRAAIAGTFAGDYWISLGLLLAFAVPALLLGLVLRRPLISFNRGLVEALESTKLM